MLFLFPLSSSPLSQRHHAAWGGSMEWLHNTRNVCFCGLAECHGSKGQKLGPAGSSTMPVSGSCVLILYRLLFKQGWKAGGVQGAIHYLSTVTNVHYNGEELIEGHATFTNSLLFSSAQQFSSINLGFLQLSPYSRLGNTAVDKIQCRTIFLRSNLHSTRLYILFSNHHRMKIFNAQAFVSYSCSSFITEIQMEERIKNAKDWILKYL